MKMRLGGLYQIKPDDYTSTVLVMMMLVNQ